MYGVSGRATRSGEAAGGQNGWYSGLVRGYTEKQDIRKAMPV